MPDRIDSNEDGVDDVVIENVTTFRMERMDDGVFWIKCYRDGKSDIVFHLNSTAKIIGSHYEE